jgi:hypothetical protein
MERGRRFGERWNLRPTSGGVPAIGMMSGACSLGSSRQKRRCSQAVYGRYGVGTAEVLGHERFFFFFFFFFFLLLLTPDSQPMVLLPPDRSD